MTTLTTERLEQSTMQRSCMNSWAVLAVRLTVILLFHFGCLFAELAAKAQQCSVCLLESAPTIRSLHKVEWLPYLPMPQPPTNACDVVKNYKTKVVQDSHSFAYYYEDHDTENPAWPGHRTWSENVSQLEASTVTNVYTDVVSNYFDGTYDYGFDNACEWDASSGGCHINMDHVTGAWLSEPCRPGYNQLPQLPDPADPHWSWTTNGDLITSFHVQGSYHLDEEDSYSTNIVDWSVDITILTNREAINVNGSSTLVPDDFASANWTLASTHIESVSDEYKTGELLTRLRAELMVYPRGVLVDGAEPSMVIRSNGNLMPGEVGPLAIGGNVSGFISVTPNEYSASGQGLVYRFRLPQTQADTDYLIKWREITETVGVDDPCAVNPTYTTQRVSSLNQIIVHGNGGPAFSSPRQATLPQDVPPGSWTSVFPSDVSSAPVGSGNSSPGSLSDSPGGNDSDGNSSGFGGAGSGRSGGCSSCGGRSGSGLSSGDGGGGMVLSLSMGQTPEGLSAGSVQVNVGPNMVVTPENIESGAADDLALLARKLYYVGPFGLRYLGVSQMISAQAATRIIKDSSDPTGRKFYINFYRKADVEQLSTSTLLIKSGATPLVSWFIDSSGTANGSHKVLLEKWVSGARVNKYELTGGAGSMQMTFEDGERIEHTASRMLSAGIRSETSTISGPRGTAYQETRVYQQFPGWGGGPSGGVFEALVNKTVGTGADAQVEQFFYYNNLSACGSLNPLLMTIHPDQSWDYYEYSAGDPNNVAVVTDVYSGFGDTPCPGAGWNRINNPLPCRHINYDYGAYTGSGSTEDPGGLTEDGPEPYTARTVTESVLDQTISVRHAVIEPFRRTEYQAVDPTDPTRMLVTVTGLDGGGRVTSVQRPDGTLTLFNYGGSTAGYEVVEYTGAPNANSTAVVDGQKTDTVLNSGGQLASRIVTDIASKQITYHATCSNPDDLLRFETVTYLDGTSEARTFDCCGLATATDRDGVVTTFGYDALKRVISTTRLNITQSRILDAAGNVLRSHRIGSDGSVAMFTQLTYDLAGRVVSESNPLGGTTQYADSAASGRRIRTTTYPDTGTRIETYYIDGALKTLTGTAVAPIGYTNTIEQLPASQWVAVSISTNLDGNYHATSEWIKTYYDGIGRDYLNLYSDGSSTQKFYNDQGQLREEVDPDNVVKLYAYNPRGELEYTAIDMNNGAEPKNGKIDFAGTDRITRTVSDVFNGPHGWTRRTRAFAWNTDNVDIPLLTSDDEVSLNGLHSWSTSFGQTTEMLTTYGSGGARTQTTTAPDASTAVSQYLNGRLMSVTRRDARNTRLAETDYAYDPHGRILSATDARCGATTYSYNLADQPAKVTTPPPAAGAAGQVTQHNYDTMGRENGTVLPDNTSVTRAYDLQGRLQQIHGSRSYPVRYGYDAQGRMAQMTTWKSFATDAGQAVTTWSYDPQRGFLSSKSYDGPTPGPSYQYTSAGRLWKRHWRRNNGITTTYSYNEAGDLKSVTYSDGTPATEYTHDRLGRQQVIHRNGITTTIGYNDAGEVLSEEYSGGTLNGLGIVNGYDSLLRRSSISAAGYFVSYGYDAASRLSTVNSSTAGAKYTYVTNSPLVARIDLTSGQSPILTRTYAYDNLNRVTSVVSLPLVAPRVGYTYKYDLANQRTNALRADGIYWVYQYDSLGQVTSGKRYWGDGTPIAGEQFGYTFDDIGNRQGTLAGGDQSGQNLRSASYDANNLNQYRTRTVPRAIDVLGAEPDSSTTVTINGKATYRHQSFFRSEVSVNSGSADWHEIDVATNGTVGSSGHLFVPAPTETFSHDDDGNLTQDGHWLYTWDGENRLVQVVSPAGGVAPAQLIRFEYDWRGRRIRKQVWNNADGSGNSVVELKFLYDGWNLVSQINGTNAGCSFAWGTDVSGSLQGGGGVGGLLWEGQGVNGVAQFPGYDGNGNIVVIVDAVTGAASTHYEYGPFGELLRASGSMAKANPFRFSTKYQDDEADLVYYGYREYAPSIGRWLSRDPINEEGGIALYGAFGNDPVLRWDRLGQEMPVWEKNLPPEPSPWPVPSDYNAKCCNSARTAKSLEDLNGRFKTATDYIAAQGTKPDRDEAKPNTLSCYDSAETILSFMKPIPPCWICFVEQRGPWAPGMYSHNAIVCFPVSPFRNPVYFDWFGGADKAKSYLGFTTKFPTTMETYPNDRPSATCNDCSKLDTKWEPDNAILQRRIDRSK